METRRTEMLCSCETCAKKYSTLCKYGDKVIDEYRDSCVDWIIDPQYGYGIMFGEDTVDECGHVERSRSLLEGVFEPLSRKNSMRLFFEYIELYGLENTVTMLVNAKEELDSLTPDKVSSSSGLRQSV